MGGAMRMIPAILLLAASACVEAGLIAPERTAARDPGGSILIRAAEIAAHEAFVARKLKDPLWPTLAAPDGVQ